MLPLFQDLRHGLRSRAAKAGLAPTVALRHE